jgi:hydroxypyruvate reductase
VNAGTLVRHALDDSHITASLRRASAVHVIAAGKASAAMLDAFASASPVAPQTLLGIGPARTATLPRGAEWQDAGHPLPNDGSVAGARRALEIARRAAPGDLIVVLLSGGGSALMALPADGVTLAEKQQAAAALMAEGADIHELNTVRKHLSAIKGGRLAAAAAAPVLTLALSDVVGDDLSVIASGPTVPDASTFADALHILERRGGARRYPAAVVDHLRRAASGALPETPKPGDPRLSRSHAILIGRQRGAIEAAQHEASALGYTVRVVPDAITGEARVAAERHVDRIAALSAGAPRPCCVLSSGETTVTVRGTGRGGRNQEFALALAAGLPRLGGRVAAASIGTDGIDGPTDAAGAIVDDTTMSRASASGLDAGASLDNNDAYAFFDRLADLVRTGPTSTNVGDIQIVILD